MNYVDMLLLSSFEDQMEMEEARINLLNSGVDNELAERRIAFNRLNGKEYDDMSYNQRFSTLEKYRL